MGDEMGKELGAAGDLVAIVQRLDVDVYGMRAEFEARGDLLFTVAAQQVLEGLAEARAEISVNEWGWRGSGGNPRRGYSDPRLCEWMAAVGGARNRTKRHPLRNQTRKACRNPRAEPCITQGVGLALARH